MAARLRARAIRERRLKAQQAMETAAQGNDISALQQAISAAREAGVGLAPKGSAADGFVPSRPSSGAQVDTTLGTARVGPPPVPSADV